MQEVWKSSNNSINSTDQLQGDLRSLRRFQTYRKNVLGFRATGTVTADDYESVIIPAVEAMFSQGRKVRFLYDLGEDFSGFEAAAMWDDTKLGLKHFSGWDRVALVSDVEWIRWAVKIFGLTMPGHVRVFENCDLAEAQRWVSE